MEQINEQDIATLNQAINIFLYAKKLNIKKVCKNGKVIIFFLKFKNAIQFKFSHKVQIYILETNPNILQWLSENKKFPKSRIFLTNIINISTTCPFNLNSKKFNIEGILSIQYKEKNFLILEFEKKEERILWEQGLKYFVSEMKQNPQMSQQKYENNSNNQSPKSIDKHQKSSLAIRLFDQQDITKEGILSFPEIQQICQQLHLRLLPKFLHPLFTKFSNNDKITKENFQKFIWEIQIKQELKDLYERYSINARNKNNNYTPDETLMTPEDFLAFCQHEQFEFTVGREQISDLMEMFNSFENPQEQNISLVTFCSIIFNQVNSIFDSKKKMIYQNMTLPLNSYFIKSTNFKLQPSSTKYQCINQYINVLKFGYRYIEINVWEGPYGDPGLFPENYQTFIPCEVILEAIANYGFESNSYPLIIGLNLQCCEMQQDRLVDKNIFYYCVFKAELIIKYFGDMIYTLPQRCWEMENLPSPEELQNKILIHSYGYFEQACQILQGKYIDTKLEDQKFAQFGSKGYQEFYLKQKGVSNHLLKIVSLFGQKIGLNKPINYSQTFNLNCLSSKKLNKIIETKESQLIQFNKKYLTKISPFLINDQYEKFNIFDGFLSGSSISCIGDTSNEIDLYYYESKFKKQQNFAYNYNFYRFQENGGLNSGYVLKPYFMRPEESGIISPSKDFKEIQQEIMLNIISAYQLIVPEDNQQYSFELEVSVIGKNENQLKIVSEKIISDGFKVNFLNFTVKFPICCPELSMILFKMNYENGIMGFYGIPVSCIRSGYRMIPLRNPTNLEIMENSSIFAYVICKELK